MDRHYRGILNLIVVLLILSNARAALENIIKYGVLVDPLSWLLFFTEGSKHRPALLIALAQWIHVALALAAERLLAKPDKHLLPVRPILVGNLAACIALPPLVIFSSQTHPISTSLSLMLVSIVFLKLVSYHMMNAWCRDARLAVDQRPATFRAFLKTYTPSLAEAKPKAEPLDEAFKLRVLAKYPANLTLHDLASFMFFPTLCYDLEFARTDRIRKRFLMRRIVELVLLVHLDMALIQQWIIPTVNNSFIPFRQMQFTHMLERLLKLAIPNHIIWLIWFYLFFHSFLNIVAELTHFAERQFYRDWWNSESVYYFWSNWNIPVHKWCLRHLYVPLMALGLSKCQASTAVFMVSAFFHEYLVSIPLKMFRVWAFTGMLMQLPWARFVSTYFSSNLANVAVWLSLIIGQPLCILMYYHDYYVTTHYS